MASNLLRTDEGATSIGGLARNAAIGTVVALVAVVVVFLVAKATGSDLELTPVGEDAPIELSIGFPIFATIVGGIVGALHIAAAIPIVGALLPSTR